tara:strand:+ start:186 stop:353 length:168 start_codon:yes stop_codon:yes gene_type:complete
VLRVLKEFKVQQVLVEVLVLKVLKDIKEYRVLLVLVRPMLAQQQLELIVVMLIII